MKTKKKTGISRLLEFSGKYKILIIISVILSAVSALISLCPFICIYYVIEEIFKAAPDISKSNFTAISNYGWMAVIFAISGLVVYFIALMSSHIAAFHTAKNMESQALHHLAKLPMGFHTTHTSGALRKNIDESASQTESFIAHQIPDLAGAYTTPIVILVMLLVFDWRLGLITLLSIVVGFAVQMKMMTKESANFMKKLQTELEDMNNEAVEYVRGISVVKVFGQTVHSFKSFYNSIMRYKEFVTDYAMSWQKPMTLFTTVINGIFVLLVPAGILFLSHGSDYKGFLLSFIFYIIFTPACAVMLMRIMFSSNYKIIAKEAVSRIDNLLSEEPLINLNDSKIPLGSSITFKNVSFSYPSTERKAIDNINFTIPQGNTAALVGPSGGGKSTIATLIPRFFDVQEGSILIGGVDIKNMSTETLMKQISFVFQDSKLFKTSILENVRMGRSEASEEQVKKALKAAMCEDIIEKLPEGIYTKVGQKGIYLSGGEVQRIVLARAILKNSPIIILDEATAFADPENEYKIQLAFEKLMKGKTVLMIAHRLSTVKNASQILVINDGKIAEQGNHNKLILKQGIYNKMWEDYTQSVTWTVKKVLSKEADYVS